MVSTIVDRFSTLGSIGLSYSQGGTRLKKFDKLVDKSGRMSPKIDQHFECHPQ